VVKELRNVAFSGKSSSCSFFCSPNRFCQFDGSDANVTCTAVTLYSGQFVAQSEFSVVTTLAPDSG
jgi:hypothetical protein